MRKSKEAPFVFGVRVEGDSFTDRREETERLKANFTYGVNTILISPRRMGKTSLVDKVCSLVESEDIRIKHRAAASADYVIAPRAFIKHGGRKHILKPRIRANGAPNG